MAQKPSPELYHRLRDQALVTTADMLGMHPDGDRSILVLLTEMDMGTSVTVVTMADGTTSFYLGYGGGAIGGGKHESIRACCARALAIAETLLPSFQPVEACPPAAPGQVIFYARTFDGMKAYVCRQDEILQSNHPFGPLFGAAQDVLTGFRLLDPERQQ